GHPLGWLPLPHIRSCVSVAVRDLGVGMSPITLLRHSWYETRLSSSVVSLRIRVLPILRPEVISRSLTLRSVLALCRERSVIRSVGRLLGLTSYLLTTVEAWLPLTVPYLLLLRSLTICCSSHVLLHLVWRIGI